MGYRPLVTISLQLTEIHLSLSGSNDFNSGREFILQMQCFYTLDTRELFNTSHTTITRKDEQNDSCFIY